MSKAPRHRLRLWHGLARGGWLAAGLWLAGAAAAQTSACGDVVSAEYDAPTDRYPHGVLGDALEWGALRVNLGDCDEALVVTLPRELVFEDVAPRLAQLDGQGPQEIITVESHAEKGARLAVWGLRDGSLKRLTTTPFIGTRFRWLAPVGAADLDGDGAMEIAYVDRPHLARILRVWRYAQDGAGGRLTEVARMEGVTNHRIGETDIAGGIRHCDGGPEMIVADSRWREVLAVRFDGRGFARRALGAHQGRASFAAAMTCQPLP